MATRELTILIKSIDQASPTHAAIIRSLTGMGVSFKTVLDAGNKGAAGLFDRLTSLKVLIPSVLGYISAHQIVASFNDAAKALEAIGDASERLGMSVQGLSVLKYMADLNNVSFEELTGIFENARNKIGQLVVTGESKASPFLKRLGVQLTDASGNMRSIEELVPELAAAINALPSGEQGVFVEKIFGNQRALNVGLEKLAAFRGEAERLGVVFSPEQVAAAQRYRDAIDRVAAAWLGVRAKAVEALGPGLADLLNQAAGAIAAGPELLGTVWKRVVLGMTDAQGKKDLDDMWMKLGQLAAVGSLGVVEVGGEAALVGLKKVLRVLWDEVSVSFATTGMKALADGIDVITKKTALLSGVPGFSAVRNGLAGVGDALRTGIQVADLSRDARMSENMVLTGQEAERLGASVKRLAGDVGGAASEFGAAADKALDLSAILKRHQVDVDATTRAYQGMRGAAGAAFERTDFFGGLKAGIADLDEQTRNWYKSGQQAAGGIEDALATNLAGALKSSAQDVRNLGDAWRTAGAKAVEAIGDIALKLAATRLVSAGLGFLSSLGSPNQADESGQLSLFFQTRHQGGPIDRYSGDRRSFVPARRYHGGGMLGHDEVPIIGQVGEHVMTAAAASRMGRRQLDAINAGASPQEVYGGGGGGTIVQNFYLSGKATPEDARMIGSAAKAAVLEAMQRDPSYRGAVRSYVGGAA